MENEVAPQMEEQKPGESPQNTIGNEICNLWYELNYLRFLLSKVIEHAQPKDITNLIDLFNEQMMKEARQFSRESLKLRYPGMNFQDTTQVKEEKLEEKSE